MRTHTSPILPQPRAFALTDAIISILTLAILLSLLLLTTHRSRAHTHQHGSITNLHQFASVTASYAADFQDHIWSYTWRSSDPFASTAAQAVDIARRRGLPNFPNISSWVAPVLTSHWVLNDYLDQPLSGLRFRVSPGDRNRMNWSNHPQGFAASAYLPFQPDGSVENNARWPYTSSYMRGPAFWSPDHLISGVNGVVILGSSHHFYTMADSARCIIGGRRTTEVTHPSHKVFLFDSAQWSGVKAPLYWAHPAARVPILLVDGSAHVRPTGAANHGFQPNNWSSPFPTIVHYEPQPWEPGVSATFRAHYSFTRAGLKGRDYDALEVPVTP